MSRIIATRAGRFALATVIGLAIGAYTDEPLAADLANASAPAQALPDGGVESPVTAQAGIHPATPAGA
jgi:hypothetical protein